MVLAGDSNERVSLLCDRLIKGSFLTTVRNYHFVFDTIELLVDRLHITNQLMRTSDTEKARNRCGITNRDRTNHLSDVSCDAKRGGASSFVISTQVSLLERHKTNRRQCIFGAAPSRFRRVFPFPEGFPVSGGFSRFRRVFPFPEGCNTPFSFLKNVERRENNFLWALWALWAPGAFVSHPYHKEDKYDTSYTLTND